MNSGVAGAKHADWSLRGCVHDQQNSFYMFFLSNSAFPQVYLSHSLESFN